MRVPQPDIIEHFGNADAVPHTEPQRGASERNRRFAAALGAEIRRSDAYAVRRELCGIALYILSMAAFLNVLL